MRACAPSLPSDLHLRGPSDRAEGKAIDEVVRCPGVVAGAVRHHHGDGELAANQADTGDCQLAAGICPGHVAPLVAGAVEPGRAGVDAVGAGVVAAPVAVELDPSLGTPPTLLAEISIW